MRTIACGFTNVRPRRIFTVLLLAPALLATTTSTAWGAAPAKRARPPKFNRSITDVFFADAREKLVGTRPDKVASAGAATGGPSSPATSSAPSAGSSGWSKWISAEVLEDEIKAQQIKLAAAVQNPTRFKGGDYQQARLHLSALATLFAIDAEYGETMRWQREAPAVRDLLARAGFNCKVGTDASYKEAKLRSDDLEGLVRGGTIQQPASTSEVGWAKISDRAPLMKRLEQSQQQGLAPWSANEAEFARNADKLSHEAQLVAALAEVIQHDGYEFADDRDLS